MFPPDTASLWNGWQAPAELNSATPRSVEFTGHGKMLAVAAVLLMLGGIGGAAGCQMRRQHELADIHRMQTEWRDAQGVVKRLWHVDRGHSNLTYMFVVGPDSFQGETEVRSTYWFSLHTGQAIPIRYLPSDPHSSFPAGNPPEATPVWLPFTFLGLLVLGGSIPSHLRMMRRLLAEGQPAPAIVTDCFATNKGGVVLRYSFSSREGGEYSGSAGGLLWLKGTVFCVMYHPANLRRHAIYPLSEVDLVGAKGDDSSIYRTRF